MKQKGYTLAEVLICVGIVGVLAAILLPLANKYRPDSTKALYVKTFNAVTDTVRSMASNQVLYPINDGSTNYSYLKAPLFNTSAVTIAGKSYGGNAAKFCQLFALNFATTGDASCSTSKVTYSDSTTFNSPSFTMANGMQFVIGTELTMPTKYQSDIYFDINGKEGNNCLYNAEKCKNPDRFKLIVSGDGHVMAADPMGQAYLENRMNWRKTDITPTGTLLSAVPDEWVVKPDVVETPVATEPEPTPEPEPEPDPEPTPPAPAPEPDPEPEPEPEPDFPIIKPIEPIERKAYCPDGHNMVYQNGKPAYCIDPTCLMAIDRNGPPLQLGNNGLGSNLHEFEAVMVDCKSPVLYSIPLVK